MKEAGRTLTSSDFFDLARSSTDRLERLAYSELTADVLAKEGKTIESIGSVGEFIALGNRSYQREGDDLTGIDLNGIHQIFSGIVDKLPIKKP